ncbi:unnamed protein product [Lactuca saligna]|uniref:Protein kinase domain-containing protein n=1 Tax=Lactuca saligna TaxID=75948 RepID=A0AA35UWT2_LACSI|nr:unnamed protein product [Lactuca saligna]
MDTSSESGSQTQRSIPAIIPRFSGDTDHDPKDISLRQWLDNRERSIDALENMHIFMQIVKIVSLAHSQGLLVHNIRPSCFVMSSFSHVSFIESASCSDSSSDSDQDVSSSQTDSYKNLPNDFRNTSENKQVIVKQQEEDVEETKHVFPMKQILHMEMKWYTSPEEAAGGPTSCSSDVYRLGVLLFELYCPCSSPEEKNATMSTLKHRLFPPQFHCKWPKEAFFSMRLLHPDPASRPKIHEVLQSEFLSEPKEKLDEREAAIELEEKIVEQEMLLEFLLELKQRKQEALDYLHRDVTFLSSDLQQVTNSQSSIRKKGGSNSVFGVSPSQNDNSRKRIRTQENQENGIPKCSRLMKNFKKLESAYFSTRHKTSKPNSNPFLEGLSKYMSYTGVNKKIKVFEYDSILNENRDIHFPIVEIPTRSKLSSISWNRYIKSQIASSNFEGLVQIWDVTQNQVSAEMREHERRVWSVDFSVDPTLLASGSDDGSVKLWNINQGGSIGTIKTKANVCCVKFPCDSSNFVAFGSADHIVYYYDLRNLSIPLCTLFGHKKTVSYIKFVDSKTLVSSSTDNTMKLWDLSDCTSRVLDRPLQSFTGHVNMKNFVGLSVSDGYIATGSETNEVFIYHKAFPMPALSYKFKATDPISGNEVDSNEQFISSVCWRNQSSTLVAANSMGNIKILEMV